jgi:hypothetical protein
VYRWGICALHFDHLSNNFYNRTMMMSREDLSTELLECIILFMGHLSNYRQNVEIWTF